MSQLADKAMIARLRMSKWEGHKYDGVLSRELTSAHGAESGTARVNKLIVPKDSIQPVITKFSEVYTYHRTVTLPWFDTGERVLPAQLYLEYSQEIKHRTVEAFKAVGEFVDRYPAILHDAKRRLNGMYRESDFPSVDTLSRLYSIDVAFLPIPVSDIRVAGVDADELARINADKEQEIQRAVEGATGECWRRIYDSVSRMHERLNAYGTETVTGKDGRKTEKVVGKFHDTLVTNLRDLAGLLPRLNFTGDEGLTRMTDRLVNELCKHGPDTLRESTAVREVTAKRAGNILKDLEGYMTGTERG